MSSYHLSTHDYYFVKLIQSGYQKPINLYQPIRCHFHQYFVENIYTVLILVAT